MRTKNTAPRYITALLAMGMCHCADPPADTDASVLEAKCAPQSELRASQEKLDQAAKHLESLLDEVKAFRELSRVLETHAVEGIPLSRPGCLKVPCIVRSTVDACALVERDPDDPPRFTGPGVIEGQSERPFFNDPEQASLSDIEISACQLAKNVVPFVSWRVEGTEEFRYIQQLATEKEYDVCGAGCATFVKGTLLLHAATDAEVPPPYSRYAWKGSADGRGRFVPIR